MTTILVDLRHPSPDGTDAPSGGYLEFVPTRRRPIDGTPDYIVLPDPFAAELVDGKVTVQLAPTGPSWVWRVDERATGGDRRYVAVPSTGTVSYQDLIDVDPETLDPDAVPEAAWWAVAGGLQVAHDEAVAAALAAGISQTAAAASAAAALASQIAAGNSETAAGNSQTAAAGSATAANTSATNAQTARTGAETARTGAEAARDVALAQTFAGVALGTADLNAIVAPGIYFQSVTANVTLASHYPDNAVNAASASAKSGTLIVRPWSGPTTYAPMVQEYTTVGSVSTIASVTYRRTQLAAATWTPWRTVPVQRIAQTAGQLAPEIFTWDDVNSVERQIAPIGTSLTSTTDLNTVTIPGVYRSIGAANATLALNYPFAGTHGALEVLTQGATILVQRWTPVSTAAPNARVIYQRVMTAPSVWSVWRTITSQRIVSDPLTGPAPELYTWDDANGVERQIMPTSILLGTADLNTVTSEGFYYQPAPANVTAPTNYPPAVVAASAKVGRLIVSRWAVSGTYGPVIQQYITAGSATIPSVIYSRTQITTGTWNAWRVTAAQRVDQTAGRAIYTFDEVNQREQIIYGDTGWRRLTPPADFELPAGGMYDIRRIDCQVFLRLRIQIAVGAAVIGTNRTATYVGVLSLTGLTGFTKGNYGVPGSWVGTFGSASAPGAISNAGSLPRFDLTPPASATGSRVAGDTIFGEAAWVTDDAWPTSLPGSAVGTIPNV